MFKLMRFFSLTSAAIVTVITFLFVGVFDRHQMNMLTVSKQTRNIERGRGFAGVIWGQFGTYLTASGNFDRAALLASPETAAINARLRDLSTGSSVLQLKIYHTNGQTLYSSEPAQIGVDKTSDPVFVKILRTGLPTAKVSHVDTFHSLNGTLHDVQVVESYIPYFGPAGDLQLVFEIYSDVTRDVQAIKNSALDVAIMTILAFGFLYCALLLIVRKAERVMRDQYGELASFSTRLESQVAQRTHGLMNQQAMLSAMMKSDSVRHGTQREAFGTLTRVLAETLDVERVGIWLFTAARTAFVCQDLFERTPRRQSNGQELKVADFPLYFDAVLNREMIVADNALDNVCTNEFADSYLVPLGIASMLVAPIVVGGRVAGVVCIEQIGAPCVWSPEAKLLNAAVANLAALVMERVERVSMEHQLREANDTAACATRAKSEFLANMSHEIRTPMNGVFGMTEILLRTELSDRQRRLVETLQQSAKTLLVIINDILDISRIEAGKLELDAQDFDLRHCLEGAVAIFEEQTQQRDVEIGLFVADDVPAYICADAVRIRQIFVNLVGNAVKFTTEGEITLRVTSVGRCDAHEMVRFEIRDTGIGIDPVVKSRLFEPFSQADTTISRRFGGTGLGLSISKHLVEMMGGQIKIDSMPGKGTTVAFVLPVRAVEPRDLPARPDITVLRNKRILIVDDRAANREIVASYLDGSGAETTTAENGHAALVQLIRAQAQGRAFSAAILDVIMPGMSGLELARAIRATKGLEDLRLAFLTSLSWKGDTRMVRDLGVRTLLTKPVRRRELLEEVAALLGAPHAQLAAAESLRSTARPRFAAHVLVAEDNPVNIEVAREFLQDLGATVVIAVDGREAVEAACRVTFDIIFMDLQMPNLDGLGATANIRAHERAKASWRTPIVGLTANAFSEDRTRCLAGDMDDYLSKPFTEEQLQAILERWISAKRMTSDVTAPQDAAPAIAVHQMVAAMAQATPDSPVDMAMIDGLRRARPGLLARLVSAYLGHAPGMIVGLMAAAADGSLDGVRIAAHSLKSSSASLGAANLSVLFAALERLAGAGDAATIAPLLAEITTEFDRVRTALEAQLPPKDAGRMVAS